jgi:hypothetical protein
LENQLTANLEHSSGPKHLNPALQHIMHLPAKIIHNGHKTVLNTVADQPMFSTGDKYKYQTFVTPEAVSFI